MQNQKKKSKFIKIILYIFIVLSALLIPLSETEPIVMETYSGEIKFDGNSAFDMNKEICYNFQNRVVGTRNNHAISNWTAEKFIEYGLEVSWQNYTTYNFDKEVVNAKNVIGIKKGESQKSIVIMSHHDVVVTTAQGANDNGAGVSVIMQLAEIFAPLENKYTLVFVSVDAEETGLHGSKEFIEKYEQIDDVFVAVVIDMCSWKNATAIELYGSSTLDGEFSDAWPISLGYNVGKKNGFNVRYSPKQQFINRLTLFKGTTDSTSFVEAGIPSIGIGDTDSTDEKRSYPWYHSWRDTINETSPSRFQYVGNFTERYIRSLLSIDDFEKQGELYFFTEDGFIPSYAFYIHFSSYILLIGYIFIESLKKTKTITKEQKIFTCLHSLFILIIPLFSLWFIYYLTKFESFKTNIGDVNLKTYIILITVVEILCMIYIFFGNRILKKFTKKILKSKNDDFKESVEMAYSFNVLIILLFFIISFYLNALISVLFFSFCCLICLHTKPRKRIKSKSVNILGIIFAFFLPLIVLSNLVSRCNKNNFLHYIPSIISSSFGGSSVIIISLFIAIIVLNIKLIFLEKE